jgi:hypothetical protein
VGLSRLHGTRFDPFYNDNNADAFITAWLGE